MGRPSRSSRRKDKWRSRAIPFTYDVLRGTASGRFFKRSCLFTRLIYCHWLEWRVYAWYKPEDDRTWPLTFCLDHTKVTIGHSPWLTPHLQVMTTFAFYGISRGRATKYVVCLPHRPVYSASWPPFRFRCQSGALAHFAFMWFLWWA